MMVPFDHAYAVIDGDGAVRFEAGDTAAVFPLASVTKLFASYSAMLAVERGLLDIDQPAGPPGATLKHLLSHASGLAMDDDVVAAEVGTRRIYSNVGYDYIALALEAATGVSAGEWIRSEILDPLGLVSTTIPGSLAHSGRGSVADLALFAEELGSPQLMSSATAKLMTTPTFPELAGILPGYGRQNPNLWGLGPEIKGAKTPHWTSSDRSPATFGHFGQSGSFLWFDPDANRAAVFLGEQPFGAWHKENWPLLPTG